jgi:4-hydroxy-3-methylbut-2-enyl diphosphate reductase
MLSSESLAIGEMFRDAMRARFGDAELPQRFRAFDTICSATQDRQDAVIRLLDEHALDVMVVVGGFNSSNTCNLARICSSRVPTFHIAAPDGLAAADSIRHRDVTSKTEVTTSGWLPAVGPLTIGVTSGASTPDNLVEEVIRTLDRFANQAYP